MIVLRNLEELKKQDAVIESLVKRLVDAREEVLIHAVEAGNAIEEYLSYQQELMKEYEFPNEQAFLDYMYVEDITLMEKGRSYDTHNELREEKLKIYDSLEKELLSKLAEMRTAIEELGTENDIDRIFVEEYEKQSAEQ